MGILTDAKGKAIKKITANNLGAYKKWLLTDENPQYKNLSVDKNVALADIAVFADLSETQTEVVASLISKTLKSNERLNEFIDLDKQNPKVVAQVYRKYAQGKLLNNINNTLGERLSSENLAFGLALTDNGSIISNVGKPDGFGKISAENKKQFYIPKNFAHGFYVLSDYAEFCYKCSDFYHPNDEGGLMYNDPDIGIDWPIDPQRELILSPKDREWPGIRDYKK